MNKDTLHLYAIFRVVKLQMLNQTKRLTAWKSNLTIKPGVFLRENPMGPALPGRQAEIEWARPDKKGLEKTNLFYTEMPFTPQMQYKDWTLGADHQEAAKGYITKINERGKQLTIQIGPKMSSDLPIKKTIFKYVALSRARRVYNKPQAYFSELMRTCNKWLCPMWAQPAP